MLKIFKDPNSKDPSSEAQAWVLTEKVNEIVEKINEFEVKLEQLKTALKSIERQFLKEHN